jgi:hypothetical protein
MNFQNLNELVDLREEASAEQDASEWAACVVKLCDDLIDSFKPTPDPFTNVVKKTTVPEGWKDDPEGWWKHVGQCTTCFWFYERPTDG